MERVAAEGIMKGFINHLGTSDGIFQGFEKLNLLWSSLVVLVIFPCKGPPIFNSVMAGVLLTYHALRHGCRSLLQFDLFSHVLDQLQVS